MVGIEISGVACCIARKFDARSTIHHGSVLHMECSKQFDAVYCFNVLHLLLEPERKTLIRRSLQHLKDAGKETIMRRRDKEITDRDAIESIIHKGEICRIALSSNNHPYIVPLIYGYRDQCLYFHSAPEGKKIEMILENNRVCFEIEYDTELVRGEDPCLWGMKYKSVIGFGTATLIDDNPEKVQAMNIIMAHYAEKPKAAYSEDFLKPMLIIKVKIEQMTGKESID